jgi:unsaturated chondroitin disaccharide hydrolase
VTEPEADAAFCTAALDAAAEHYRGFVETYANPHEIPRSFAGTTGVRLVQADDWTSGFPAGCLWLLYAHTEDPTWLDAAETRTAALESQSLRTDTHDIGFVIENTFGAGLRLTGNAKYGDVVIRAAESLASRFDPAVGATRSWDFGGYTFPVIIDNMMNLELLFHAQKLRGGGSLRLIAETHARTTLTHHFRPDRSSYHVVDFDPASGRVLRKQTHQGLADESAWARGQAWGLYGFSAAYRETGEREFIEQARGIAEFYVNHPALPADFVPLFDFDAAARADVPKLRDVSAGAIAASALLELAGFVDAPTGERYRRFALETLRSLSTPAYHATLGENGHFLLKHGVGNYPARDELGVAINYADYYYLEALLRGARALEPHASELSAT